METDVKEAYRKFFEKNNWQFVEKNFDPWDWTEVVYAIQEGYKQQQEQIRNYLKTGAGMLLVTGTPGWGKTNTTRHVTKLLENENFVTVYFDVPPPTERDFVEQLGYELLRSKVIKKPLLSFLKSDDDYMASLGIFNLKRKLAESNSGRTIALVCDEAHSGDPKTNLNWFKIINDDKETASRLIFIGYESERVSLREQLEKTFTDRAFEEVQLRGLTRDETESLLKKRLRHKCGEKASFAPFSDVVDFVNLKSAGRPRFALKVMSKLWRHMAVNNLDKADLSDVKPTVATVEGEEKDIKGQQKLTETVEHVEPAGPPDWSVLTDFMRDLCRLIAEFPGLSAEELAAKLNSDKHVVWTNLARLSLKDKGYQKKFVRANITEPVVVSRKHKAGGRMRKGYYIGEQYKGEFVKS